MAKVKDILKEKGSSVHAIPPSATVLDALKAMADKKIGAILIMDDEKLVGIFSERDFSRKVTLQGKSEITPITDVMTKNVYYVSNEQTIDECLALMIDKNIRHLPIMEKEKVVGVVSIRDLVKEALKGKEIIIKSLENFIISQDTYL